MGGAGDDRRGDGGQGRRRERGASLTAPHISSRPEGVPPHSSFTPGSLTKQGARIIFNDQTEARLSQHSATSGLASFHLQILLKIYIYIKNTQEQLD